MVSKNFFYIFVKVFACNAIHLINHLTKIINKKLKILGSSKLPLLAKVTERQTYLTNKWLIITIFSFVFAVTIITYYEQKYIYLNQLESNLNLISYELNKTINSYKESLEALSYNNLWKNPDLSENKISQIIKSTKSNNLANAIWHPNDGSNKAFGIYGAVKHQLIFQNMCRRNTLADLQGDFTVQEYLNHNNQPILLMLQKVHDGEKQTYGYLTLPTTLTSFLELASPRILDSEVIRINNAGNSIYFDKSKPIYLTNDEAKKFYIFSKNAKLNFTPYEIALGMTYKQIFKRVIQTLYSRYLLIIALGSVLIFVYNFLEKSKVNKLYKDSFEQEIALLQNKLELGAKQQETLHVLQHRLDSIIHANKILCNIQSEIHQDMHSTLKLLDGTNELLLKHCSGEKELEPEVIKKLFLTARNILDDFAKNIYSKNNEYSQFNIDDLIDEIILLFIPVINSKSLIINKNSKKLLKNTYIKSNKSIIGQVIINLLLRSICSVLEGATINIVIEQIEEKIAINIIDDGFITDEKLFKTIAMNNNIHLPITNLYLDLSSIKEVILDIGVTLEIKNHARNENEYTLIIPVNFYELFECNDKVIPFKKQAYWQ